VKDLRFPAAYTGLAAVTVLGLTLTACGAGTPSKTSGDLDDVKYLRSVRSVPAVTHTVTKTVPKTKRTCTGKGTKKRCTDVANGTKTVHSTVTDHPAVPGKSAMYCVELDNVKGDPHNDDQWYAVTWKTYSKWENENEGARVTSMPYLRSLYKCRH
jgi:hypothetical protein